MAGIDSEKGIDVQTRFAPTRFCSNTNNRKRYTAYTVKKLKRVEEDEITTCTKIHILARLLTAART